MASQRQSRTNPGLTFFGMIAGVMTALKLKQHWDEYRQVPESDEEANVGVAAEVPPYRDEGEEAVSLLDTELPRARATRKRSKSCCVCCGMNCGLFWKAFGIVTGLMVLWYAAKLVWWAVTPAPSPLENMPSYSTSLGCISAPHLYHDGEIILKIPIGSRADHAFDARGGTVGTIFVTSGSPDATEVEYKLSLRTSDQSLLEDVSLHYPTPNEDGSVDNSRLLISTPFIQDPESNCMRFDVTIIVPRNAKKLHIASHSTAHVQFDPEAEFAFDEFYTTLYATDDRGMILPHEGLQAKKLNLEVYNGWIVGDVSVLEHATISTQRGDGVLNLRVHPTAASETTEAAEVDFQTITGSGRTDIFFLSPAHSPIHRTIRSSHTSTRRGDVYLTYKNALFSGKVALGSASYTATGAQPMSPPVDENGVRWTHWVGQEDGADTLRISSQGWTGLYF